MHKCYIYFYEILKVTVDLEMQSLCDHYIISSSKVPFIHLSLLINLFNFSHCIKQYRSPCPCHGRYCLSTHHARYYQY